MVLFFMSGENRIYGLDVLRGVAMTLGIFLHSTIAYKVGYHYGEWAFDPTFKSYFFDWLYLWINSFRMQLFFLLAGYFSHLLIYKIGLNAFFKNRLKRIGLPFLLGYFTILPLTLLPYWYVLFEREGNPWPQLSDFFIDFFTLRTTSGFMHLWFLQHLLIYYGLAIACCYLYNKFASLERKSRVLSFENVAPWRFMIAIVIIIGLLSQLFSTPLPNIWTGFVIPLSQFTYYAAFFIIGWVLEPNRKLFFSFQTTYKWSLIAGTLVSFFLLFLVQEYAALPSFSPAHVVLKFLFSLQTALLTFGFIGFFVERFRAPNAFWKYIADSAYWVYLIHMPIVLGTQLLLINTNVPGLLRFPIVLIAGIFLSFGTYQLFVRYTWVGYLLNGRRYVRTKDTELSVASNERNNPGNS